VAQRSLDHSAGYAAELSELYSTFVLSNDNHGWRKRRVNVARTWRMQQPDQTLQPDGVKKREKNKENNDL
jgi:hypothetical protein